MPTCATVPIGLGLMGFQDALYEIGPVLSPPRKRSNFSDLSMESISYYAILASATLASERGCYQSYPGSKWDRGTAADRYPGPAGAGARRLISTSTARRFARTGAPSGRRVKNHGMRNSNTMAIAPTATISNISGISQSIEPTYKHLFVKSNLSGEFTVSNTYLVNVPSKERGLWDDEMIDDSESTTTDPSMPSGVFPRTSSTSSLPPSSSVPTGSSNVPAAARSGSTWGRA
jgi:ribonucleoside-diphosphate reductase alpha chain